MVLTVKRRRVVEQVKVVVLRQSDSEIVFRRDWTADEERITFSEEGLQYVLVNGNTVYRKKRPLLDKQKKQSHFDQIRRECLVQCTYCKGAGKVVHFLKKVACPVCKGAGKVVDIDFAFKRMTDLFESVKYIGEE